MIKSFMATTHFTYTDPDLSQLKQGDVLKKTEEIKAILKEVHPHYLKDDYLYFIVLTQTCDLIRRDGNPPNVPYITIAAVRSLELLIEREIRKHQKKHIIAKGKLVDFSYKTLLNHFVVRLLNNNESEYFYLNEDSSIGFPENCVAFLRLSISIKADKHYDTCVKAKILELREDFKAKLGWLVGNVYSRVGTEDWDTKTLPESEFKKKVSGLLEQYCFWIDMSKIQKELIKQHGLEKLKEFDSDTLLKLASDISLPTKKEQFFNRLKILLLEKKVTSQIEADKFITRIGNDPELSALLK